VSVKAATLLVAQALANLALWVPLPLAVLWIASQIDYHSGSLMLGVAAGFAVLLVGVRVGVLVVHRIDSAWLDAANSLHWRDSALNYIAASCAVVGGGGFGFWLMFVGGLQSSMFPTN
jgi:hypothetical protein